MDPSDEEHTGDDSGSAAGSGTTVTASVTLDHSVHSLLSTTQSTTACGAAASSAPDRTVSAFPLPVRHSQYTVHYNTKFSNNEYMIECRKHNKITVHCVVSRKYY